jgi:hypothetical protein
MDVAGPTPRFSLIDPAYNEAVCLPRRDGKRA